MKKYTAIIVIREYLWIHKGTGQIANPTPNEKMINALVDRPRYEAYNVYSKVAELKADRLADLGEQYHEYLRNHSALFTIPTFAPGNTMDAELIITHKGKNLTGNLTIFNA